MTDNLRVTKPRESGDVCAQHGIDAVFEIFETDADLSRNLNVVRNGQGGRRQATQSG